MNTYIRINLDDLRLSVTSRLIRLVIGAILIAIPMTQTEALGAMAILPLLGIYPVLTSILGFSLVEVLVICNLLRTERPPLQVKVARTCLFILGTGLIAYVMGNEVAPAWLALVAIFPVLMGLLDSDLVGKALLTRRALEAMDKTTATILYAQTPRKPLQGNVSEPHKPKQAA